MSRTAPRLKASADEDITEILLTEEQIRERVKELGVQISADYQGRELVLVGILRGALVFVADLSRAITIPHTFDMTGASSYGPATSSSGRVQITKDVEVNLRNKHVLICEDIYDSGRTLGAIGSLLRVHHPASVEICTFLYKKVRRRAYHVDVKYCGFEIEDRFVVGYGLDYAEHYRHLPYLGVLNSRVHSPGQRKKA